MSLSASNKATDLPEIIRRDRLFSKLAVSPVCWITAPPGAGKTVLVKSYVASLEAQYIWYQLDSSDTEVATFFQWFGVTIGNTVKNSKLKWPLFTTEYSHGLEVFAKHFFEQLYSSLSDAFVIVFDDYHSVQADSQFDQILQVAIKSLPPQGRIIVMSRSQPPSVFARLQVNQVISNVVWEDIKFSDDECMRLLKLRGVTNSEKIRFIQKQTHGWASGIVLMANQANRSVSVRLDNVWSEDYQLMFDYFATEIFDQSGAKIQNLLLQVALLPSMTIRMAAEVAQSNERFVRGFFERLYSESYFTNRHPDKEFRYEFHPLFRQFLLMRCKRKFSEAELLVMKKKAADVLHKNDFYRASARAWIELKDWPKLTEVCVSKAPMLLSIGSYNTFLNWIKHIPEEFYLGQQWLQYWHAQILSSFDPDRARIILRRVYEDFKKIDHVEGQFLSLAAASDTYFHDSIDYSSSAVWSDDFKELIARHPRYPSIEIEMHMLAGLLILIMWHVGSDKDFPWLVERCHKLLNESSDPNQCLILGFQMLWYHAFQGDTRACSEVIKILSSSIDEEKLQPVNRIRWHCIQANYYCYTMCLYDEVFVHTGHAKEISEHYGIHLFSAVIIVQEIYAGLMLGDYRRVERKLTKLWGLVNPGTRLEVYYYYLNGWKSLGLGRLEKAGQELQKALAFSDKVGMSNIVLQGYINNLYLLTKFDQGKHDEIEPVLRQLKDTISETESRLLKWMLLLFEAYRAHCLNLESANEQLRKALSFGQDQHLLCFPGQAIRFLMPLYIKAFKHDIEIDYVKSLIKAQAVKPDLQSRLISNWPWRIKIYSLGDLRIEVEGEALVFTGKQQRRPLELLKLIIAHNGQPVRVPMVIETLWPDASSEAGENNFKTTLARLRKLVGKSAVELVDAKLSIAGDDLWVDAWTVFELIKLVVSKAENGVFDKADYDQVMQLNAGDFLKGNEAPYWVLSYREQIKTAYMHVIERYASYLLDKEQYATVAEMAGKALEADELCEVFYRLLMQAHINLGNQAEVVKTYRRCQRIFSERLSIEPSLETKSLLSQVSKGDS